MEPFMELSRRERCSFGVEGESPQPVSFRVARASTRLRCGSHAFCPVPLIECIVPLVDAELVLTRR